MSSQQTAVLLIIALGMLPVRAVPDSNSKPENTELGIVNTDRVNLRTSPSSSAPVKAQLRLGSWILVSGDRAKTNSQSWRRVIRNECLDESCSLEKRTGWIAEDYVTLVSSFVRINNWKESYLELIRK
jgi:hypothetical protein